MSQFDDEQLKSLSDKLELQLAGKNVCLIEHGCSESFSLYLISGAVDSTARDKKVTRFESNTDGELLPIAQIRPSLYRVVTSEPTKYFKDIRRPFDRVCTTS